MRIRMLIPMLWLATVGTLSAQTISITELLRLVHISPAAFEQEMGAKGYTCYQRKKSLMNWSCLFMDQRPAYLNQPALASQVVEYVFGPNATVLIEQTKQVSDYKSWQSELISLGFVQDKKLQAEESVGVQFTRESTSVILRKVDYYNGISNNQTGYSASITWMRQPILLTQKK